MAIQPANYPVPRSREELTTVAKVALPRLFAGREPAVGAPFVVPSPRYFRQATSASDGPNPGAGATVDYSLPVNAANTLGMTWQPAWHLSAPMQSPRVLPDYRQLDSLQVGLGQPGFQGGGFPTFFPVGNRAANSASDPYSGKPEGLRMLVVMATRYNQMWRDRRGGKDVRRFTSQPYPSRAGTQSAAAGG